MVYKRWAVFLYHGCINFQESSQFVTQTKELDSFNNDLRQTCRKVG